MSARSLLTAVLLGTLAVAVACSADPPRPAPPPTIEDLAGVTLPRFDFCDLVPHDAVAAALGITVGESDESSAASSWQNGTRAEVDGIDDVFHEHGCEWRSGNGRRATVARAWLFARPVDRPLAEHVIDQAAQAKDCDTSTMTGFGDPSMRQDCATTGDRVRLRHAGLFGDTWLTCEVTTAVGSTGLTDRAEQWCVAVAITLRGGESAE